MLRLSEIIKLKELEYRSHIVSKPLKRKSTRTVISIYHNYLVYNAFAQAKNVIEKQINLGNRIKTRNLSQKILSARVKEQKVSSFN